MATQDKKNNVGVNVEAAKDVEAPKATRKTNKSLAGVRGSINPEVLADLEAYEDRTSLERGKVMEAALSMFFAATSEARKAAYEAVESKRVTVSKTIQY